MAGELRDEVVDRSRTFNLVQLVWEDAEHRKESTRMAWRVPASGTRLEAGEGLAGLWGGSPPGS